MGIGLRPSPSGLTAAERIREALAPRSVRPTGVWRLNAVRDVHTRRRWSAGAVRRGGLRAAWPTGAAASGCRQCKPEAPGELTPGASRFNARDDHHHRLHRHHLRHHEHRLHRSVRHRRTLHRPRCSDGRRSHRLTVPGTLPETGPGDGCSRIHFRASPGSSPRSVAEGRPQRCSLRRSAKTHCSGNDPSRAATESRLKSTLAPDCARPLDWPQSGLEALRGPEGRGELDALPRHGRRSSGSRPRRRSPWAAGDCRRSTGDRRHHWWSHLSGVQPRRRQAGSTHPPALDGQKGGDPLRRGR